MERAVFLDRDGVINRAIVRDGRPYSPASVGEFEILGGVPDALKRLKDAQFKLIVVTNQPDIARGTATAETLSQFHDLIRRQLPLDDVMSCIHDDKDNCACRKPKPGLLLEARDRFGLSLEDSFMVGDRWRDIEAGRSAGCRTVFIEYHYAERGPLQPPDYVCASLGEAADWILNNVQRGGDVR